MFKGLMIEGRKNFPVDGWMDGSRTVEMVILLVFRLIRKENSESELPSPVVGYSWQSQCFTSSTLD